MVKINLKALKNEDNSTSKEELVEEVAENIKDTTSEVKVEEVIVDTKPRAKISLKDLNIKSANDNNAVIEDKKIEPTETKVVESEKTDTISEIKTEEKIEEVIVEEPKQTEEIVSEEINQEENQEKKVETFSISDGDTNCNIIQDKKVEIFANYKGSYSPKVEVKEEKKEIIEAISDEVIESKETEVVIEAVNVEEKVEEPEAIIAEEASEVKEKEEIIEIKAEEEIKDEIQNEIITEKVTEEKTNLEKYKEGNNETKKIKNILKNKKVIATSVFVFVMMIVGGIIGTLNFKDFSLLKANIQENKTNIEQDLSKKELPNKVEEDIEIDEPKIINDNLPEKVNENITPNVDNNPKTNTMDTGIENYLIRKYKTN